MVDVKINVEGEDRVESALRVGLDEGLEEAGKYLLERGAETAEDEVVGARKVWTEEVKKGFETEVPRFNRMDHWTGSIVNPVKHADIVDEGIDPAGKHENPDIRIQDIMPWVVAHLSPADYDGGDGDPGLTDFNGGDGPDGSSPLSFEDDSVEVEYIELDALGLREKRFASEYVKAGVLGDGTNVVWKSHKDTRAASGKDSGVENEIVWSEAQELAGYDLGPRSKEQSVETVDGEQQGTLQEFVDGEQLNLTVNMIDSDLTFDDDQGRLVNYVKDHRDWFARTNAIDYLVGNSDRHAQNIMVDKETENPRAIDNGGTQFDAGLDSRHLRGLYELTDYERSDDPETLFNESQTYLDRSEAVLDELLQDEDFKNSLIAKVEEVHGSDSQEADRIRNIIGDDIGPGHVLYEGDTGVPLYKRHIQKGRNVNTREYGGTVQPEDKVDFDYGDTIDYNDDGDSATLDEIDDHLDSVFGEFDL